MRDRPRCNACKAEFPLLGRWRVHGAWCTHSSEFMPYRDPAKRATWMRQYWQRKRLGQVSVPASLSSRPSVVRAPEPSRVWRPTIQRSIQPTPPNNGLVRKAARGSFKTTTELARTVPFGALASQVCPYCYPYSSPGTRCSCCRSGER